MANLVKRASDLVGSLLKSVGILRYINKVMERKYQSELAAIEKRHREELMAEVVRGQERVYQIMQETWGTINVLDRGIDHFRNLFHEISSNTSLMLQETDLTSSNYERLLNIRRQVATGMKLGCQLHDYVTAIRSLKRRLVDLNRLLREFPDSMQPFTKQIRIHQELAADLYPIVVNERLIKKALSELCFNAIEAMSGKGDFFLKTMNVTHEALKDLPERTKPGDYVLLTLAHTGVGMDKKTMEHAFDLFFTTKETGLGLTIVHAIIKNHGGAITVSSEEGVGTAFNIYLPAAREKKEAYSKVSERKIRPMVKTSSKVSLVQEQKINNNIHQ